MATEKITLELNSEAVRAIETATGEDRDKLALLLSTWVLEYAGADAASLKKTMNEISRRAEERGLTPEILQNILEGE